MSAEGYSGAENCSRCGVGPDFVEDGDFFCSTCGATLCRDCVILHGKVCPDCSPYFPPAEDSEPWDV